MTGIPQHRQEVTSTMHGSVRRLRLTPSDPNFSSPRLADGSPFPLHPTGSRCSALRATKDVCRGKRREPKSVKKLPDEVGSPVKGGWQQDTHISVTKMPRFPTTTCRR